MNLIKGIFALLATFISLPIWFYLLYKILVAINATELMWFLFWIYVPMTMLVSAVMKLSEKD